ncbi:hypothetical protein [Sphingomonas sp. PB4P5]|uniref:hypothetical protein n=1 Tax=Parasphingomonas puruogangriensis TaxID=3096155 RepID=UPI002FC74612
MRLSMILLATALCAGPVTAQAQSTVAPTPATKAVKGDPNRIVCKTLATTGSRLKPNKDCRTAKQWSDDQAMERRDLDRLQSNRYKGNSGI